MSRHHNTKHVLRGRSNYHARLEARGLGKAPTLESLVKLQSRQRARKEATGHPWNIFAEA